MCDFSLADDDEQCSVSHATVPYPPLFRDSPYVSALRFWREGERRSVDASDLFQRGAEQVVHNAALYESRRSSTQEVRGDIPNEAGPSVQPETEERQPSQRPDIESTRGVTRQGRQRVQKKKKKMILGICEERSVRTSIKRFVACVNCRPVLTESTKPRQQCCLC